MKLIFLIVVIAIASVAAVPAKTNRTAEVSKAKSTPGPACPKQENDACAEDDCEQCGWCEGLKSFYVRCVRSFPDDPKDNITGVIKQENCDDNHWWNPEKKPSSAAVGGSCDDWTNLSDTTKNKYLNDPNCVDPICVYGQDDVDKCSGKYWYYDPKVHAIGQRDDLTCGGTNVWDQSTETCRDRSNVIGC